jgi:hypothetical protein
MKFFLLLTILIVTITIATSLKAGKEYKSLEANSMSATPVDACGVNKTKELCKTPCKFMKGTEAKDLVEKCRTPPKKAASKSFFESESEATVVEDKKAAAATAAACVAIKVEGDCKNTCAWRAGEGKEKKPKTVSCRVAPAAPAAKAKKAKGKFVESESEEEAKPAEDKKSANATAAKAACVAIKVKGDCKDTCGWRAGKGADKTVSCRLALAATAAVPAKKALFAEE